MESLHRQYGLATDVNVNRDHPSSTSSDPVHTPIRSSFHRPLVRSLRTPSDRDESSDTSSMPAHRFILNKAKLLEHSRFIRDELILNLTSPEGGMDTARLLEEYLDILPNLQALPITVDVLEGTRIEHALLDMMDNKKELPNKVVTHTSAVLDSWATQLGGPIERIRPHLWAKHGRMEGVIRTDFWKSLDGPQRNIADISPMWLETSLAKWEVAESFKPRPDKALEFGHNGVEVGQWWLKPICAFRDGAIDDSGNPVTYDDDGVYAMILASSVEELEKDGSMPKATMTTANDAKTKFMYNMQTHNPVRILRHHRLQSSVAPKYGLRYDGLYMIDSRGQKLITIMGQEFIQVTVTFIRMDLQPWMKGVLTHPFADEMDEWLEYQRYKEEMRVEEGARTCADESAVGRVVVG